MFRWKNKQLDGLSGQKILRNVGSYTILGLALAAMTFFGVCDPQGGVQGPRGSAAVVGDEVISSTEFRRFYQQTLERFRGSQPDFNAQEFNLSQRVMDYMVGERAAYELAKELGIQASTGEVEAVILDQAERFKDPEGNFSPENFKQYLKRNGYTEASFIDEQRRAMSIQKLEQFIGDTYFPSDASLAFDYRISETKLNLDYVKFEPKDVKVEVSAKEIEEFLNEDGKKKVKEYYDRNNAEFNTPEEIKARHILVSFEGARLASGDGAKRSKENAKKRADDLLKQAKAKGANFASIAGKNTDEAAGKKKGGDLGWFKRETMDKNFSDAAFALKQGQVSEVVESPFGFHIIKLEGRKKAKNVALEDATNNIAKTLVSRKKKPELLKARADEVLAALKEGKSTKNLLKKYGVEMKATGEFAAEGRSIPSLGVDQAFRDAALKLTMKAPLVEEPLKVGANYYVLKLKSRKDADPAQLKDEKLENMRQTKRYSLARSMVSQMRTDMRKNLQDQNQIYINPEYAGWDNRGASSD